MARLLILRRSALILNWRLLIRAGRMVMANILYLTKRLIYLCRIAIA